MTDKVQKIREEVERLFNHVKDSNFESDSGAFYYFKDLLDFIDSLQEEPVSIWHDAGEKSNEPEEVVIINPSDNTGEVITRCTGVYQGRIWAYTSELLNLDNPCKIGKNLQEKPISERKCIFTKDNYTDEDRMILCENCKERCAYAISGVTSTNAQIKKEPVSEELEIVANEWDAKASFNPFYMALDDKGNPYEVKQNYTTHAESFKAGAKWQKKKDQETIELAEDHAMLAGMNKMEEQMMAKAIDGDILEMEDNDYAICSHTHLELCIEPDILEKNGFKDNDKVKVIIIRED